MYLALGSLTDCALALFMITNVLNLFSPNPKGKKTSIWSLYLSIVDQSVVKAARVVNGLNKIKVDFCPALIPDWHSGPAA